MCRYCDGTSRLVYHKHQDEGKLGAEEEEEEEEENGSA
jgi:hypothetical protein